MCKRHSRGSISLSYNVLGPEELITFIELIGRAAILTEFVYSVLSYALNIYWAATT